MTTTTPKIDTTGAVNSLVGKLEAQANGELASMFAAYKIASKLDRKGRDAVADTAVDRAFAGEDDAKVKNAKSRTRVFFGASRHFVAEPTSDHNDHVFQVGNARKVTVEVLKESLDLARKEAAVSVGATQEDLAKKGTSGERYAWASALNTADVPTTAADLLKRKGIAEFFAARLKVVVDARLAAEAKALAELELVAKAKVAAAALVADREVKPEPTQTPSLTAAIAESLSPAPSAAAVTAEIDAIRAPEVKAEVKTVGAATMPLANKIVAAGSPNMSARSDDQTAALNDLPKAPAVIRSDLKRRLMNALTHGIDQQEIRAMLAEVAKAHAAKVKEAAPKPTVEAVINSALS